MLSQAEAKKACRHLDHAIEATRQEAKQPTNNSRMINGKFDLLKQEYLDLLMQNRSKEAIALVLAASQSGMSINDIYIDVLQEVMLEIGNLWHKSLITVDKEHYCTSATQMVLSQFYPLIFSQPRNNFKILTCCIGSELHEMGIRMLTDLFEYAGWDSVYLGSAVPTAAIVKSILETKPDLVALSVTMPLHLDQCYDVVKAIKTAGLNTKIAVGGRAFQVSNDVWKTWGVDISTDNALQLIGWANTNIVNVTE